jgi:glutathione S-transferase
MTAAKPRLVGRSSSLFTRVVRILAVEAAVECTFEIVPDLMSSNSADYAGNPALKLPTLEAADGTWFGSLNICRALVRASERKLRIVWPEGLLQPLLANAQELTSQAMATEVTLIMAGLGGAAAETPHQAKLRTSLLNVLAWLDANLPSVLAALPAERDLSYLEVTLFCLVTHLAFRHILEISPYQNLAAFCQQFAERPAAQQTPYRFDARAATAS